MGDILQFDGITTVEIPVEDILEKAKNWEMIKCIVVGIDADNELCFGGSFSDTPLINLLLDHAKNHIINNDESGYTGGRHSG